jgi:hypothetical protein
LFRPWLVEKFPDEIPSTFGSRVKDGGIAVPLRDSLVSSQIGGRPLTFCYLPHPGAAEPGGKSFSIRFGENATTVLDKIARGEIQIPASPHALHQLFKM